MNTKNLPQLYPMAERTMSEMFQAAQTYQLSLNVRMTLEQAQEKWDDAVSLKISHKPNSVTEAQLIDWANKSCDEPVKPLFIKVGRTNSRIIYSRAAAREESRQMSLIPGTKVRMTGAEARIENLENTIFTVVHGPKWQCGTWVVWLDKYSGAYACEYLEKVECEEQASPLSPASQPSQK
ncbi:MAG: hypothetical protein LBK58_05010 [Prevotellaceae bacterium]|jgi:hypothetical protein|nr:hypothetical protein [Prevotellaceae bacterium]